MVTPEITSPLEAAETIPAPVLPKALLPSSASAFPPREAVQAAPKAKKPGKPQKQE